MSSSPAIEHQRRFLPRGLFARALLIVAAPIILLQAALAYVFMERHWDAVTRRLSVAAAADIAALARLHDESLPPVLLHQTAASLDIRLMLEPARVPEAGALLSPRLLRNTLSTELTRRLDGRPFAILPRDEGKIVEVQIQVTGALMITRVSLRRVYATNSHIFIVWMAGVSLLLLVIAVLFLRGQIRPIQRLAVAARKLGRGQEPGNFKPSGAREIREAAQAFIEMREKLELHIAERTQMLAGVSHDLRTPLTRFNLHLALMPEGREVDNMKRDVKDMERMLTAYLEFARGLDREKPERILLDSFIREIASRYDEAAIVFDLAPDLAIKAKRQALSRCINNLLANAVSYGENIRITARRKQGHVEVVMDDDGPGIPVGQREDVFRPFHRLDEARNQDRAGTGLGLSIARDAARAHGGDISLSISPAGGLRAIIRLPV